MALSSKENDGGHGSFWSDEGQRRGISSSVMGMSGHLVLLEQNYLSTFNLSVCIILMRC